MSRDRQHGKLIWSCDGATCPATFERDERDGFEHAWSQAKVEGWKARKIANEWLHFCGDCEP